MLIVGGGIGGLAAGWKLSPDRGSRIFSCWRCRGDRRQLARPEHGRRRLPAGGALPAPARRRSRRRARAARRVGRPAGIRVPGDRATTSVTSAPCRRSASIATACGRRAVAADRCHGGDRAQYAQFNERMNVPGTPRLHGADGALATLARTAGARPRQHARLAAGTEARFGTAALVCRLRLPRRLRVPRARKPRPGPASTISPVAAARPPTPSTTPCSPRRTAMPGWHAGSRAASRRGRQGASEQRAGLSRRTDPVVGPGRRLLPGEGRSVRYEAAQLIWAAPLFLVPRVFVGEPGWRPRPANTATRPGWSPTWPYPPAVRRCGASLAWDNVLYGSPGSDCRLHAPADASGRCRRRAHLLPRPSRMCRWPSAARPS